MKKITFILILLMAIFSAWSHDFESGGIYYNITSNTAPYTVEVTRNSLGYTGNIIIPSTISYNNITYSVTSIGENAFCGDPIRSIIMPNSIVSIGDSAFMFCPIITAITIPNSVTSIGAYAFFYCGSLTAITIPNSVTSIGNYAFNSCDSLNSIVVVNGNTKYDSRNNCNAIIETSTNTLLIGCRNTVIPNSVTSIGVGAFFYCRSLTAITIPNSVTSIGDSAFYGCSGDSKSITIPYSVTIIGKYAFAGCSLTSITIPNSVTNIGDYAFFGCGLTSITIPNSVTSIGIGMFGRCSSLTSIIIPNSVTTIGASAFFYCRSLTSITIPNSVTSIGNSAFRDCGLTSVIIGDSVANIGENVFIDCQGLTSITIPNSVTSIGDQAFFGCRSLTSITFCRTNTTIGVNSFTSCSSNARIYVPCGSSSWYIAQLPAFFNFIEVFPYTYTLSSQDTLKGMVSSIASPTCSNSNWTINAIPNSGYTFSNWSDGNTQNPRTLTITQDTNLVAYFTASSQQWYKFSIISEDITKGTVQIVVQPDKDNPQATFIALPNSGYTFSRWSDGNTQNPRSITVTQDTVLVACFTSSSQDWYNFNVLSEDNVKGTVQIVVSPTQANPQATFIALPNTGYNFARWSDGNTQNPRSIMVTKDTILIAFFNQSIGIKDVDEVETIIKVYPNPAKSQITITGLEQTDNIQIINTVGQIVKYYNNVSETITINIADLSQGLYFVKIGNIVRKLVVEK